MTRLACVTWELNSAAAGMEIPAVSAGAPSIVSTRAHGGTYSARVSSLTSGTAKGGRIQWVGSAGNGPFFVDAYINIATAPGAENCILQLNDTSAFTTPVVYITCDNSSVLRLYDEDGVIGSPTSALSVDTWYHIEIQIDRTPAAGSQIVRARLNEVEFAGSATRDLSAGVLAWNFGTNLLSEANTTGDIYFDDLSVNDSTTSYQNTYQGNHYMLFLRPNAAGDNAGWTLGTGTTYAEIDDILPDDATTTIAANTATGVDATDCSDFNIENTPAAIGASDTINYVAVGFRCNVDNATSSDPRFVARIKAAASGAVDETAAQLTDSTNWRTQNDGSFSANYKVLGNNSNYEQPGGSSAWTKAALDTTQIGVRLTVSDTHKSQVTTEWLLVDYTPSSGTAADVTESVTAADAPEAAATFVPAQSESASAAESPSAVATFVPAQAEALSATDAPSATVTVTPAQAESLTATDTQSAVTSFAPAQAESLTALDTPDAVNVGVAQISESISAIDTPAAVAAMGTAQAEALSATDIPGAVAIMPAAQAEALTALDVSDLTYITTAEITEAVTALDVSNGVLAGGPDEANEIANASDSVSVTIITAAGILESASAADLFSAVLLLPAGVSEAANATDTSSTGSEISSHRNRQLLPLGNTLSPLGN